MDKFDRVNVAVIGVGWFGEVHSRIYNGLPGARLAGVYDLDHERAGTVSASLGVTAFDSMDELLADPSIDAVDICVKDQCHLEPVLAVCRAGKHIMLEKPMALSVEECDRMIHAAAEAGVKLMVGHILRFNQRLNRARSKIIAGEIGAVRHFYARRNMPRSTPLHVGDGCGYHSIIYNAAVHEIDQVQWLSGDDVVEVYAKYQSGDIEAENCHVSDTVITLLTLRNGALAVTEHSWIYPINFPAPVDARTEITGTRGRIELDLGFKGGICYTAQGVEYFDNLHWPDDGEGGSGDLRAELETFIKCVALDLPVPVTGEDGRKVIAVARAIEASLNSGKAEKV